VLLFSVACTTVSANLVSNTTTHLTHTTITGAVAHASAGHNLIVSTGTYTEAGITVDKSLSIRGRDASDTMVQAAASPGIAANRVFTFVAGVTGVLEELTIRHGKTYDGILGLDGANGGGIHNEGNLLLSQCIVTANMTGNGSDSSGGPAGDGGRGGGIYNAGGLTLDHTTISSNTTGDGGDGAGVLVGGDGGDGAGIYNSNSGSLLLYRSTVRGNSAGEGGSDQDGWYGGEGGGIYNAGVLLVIDSTVSGNISGNGSDALAGYWGGDGGNGGGIRNWGPCTLSNSTVSGNTTGHGGGGGLAGYGGDGGNGAGICNSGALTLHNTTVSSNHTGAGGWASFAGDGGDGGGILVAFETATLIDSTIARNSTGAGGEFGGVGGDGGGLYVAGTATGIVGHVILADNSAASGAGSNCWGAMTSRGYNLVEDTNDCTVAGDTTGNVIGQDPLLGALQNNGGPTWTHALLPGSPAIDAGNLARTTGMDQRYVCRPLDGKDDGTNVFDIGSYEFVSATADSDGDGLADGDEVNTYGTSPLNTNTDGDAHTDYEEMVADTDGTNSNDYLRITAISNNSPVMVYFKSSSNRWYTMDYSSNLLHVAWTNVPGTDSRKGVHGPDSMVDTNAASWRLYRLTVGFPPGD